MTVSQLAFQERGIRFKREHRERTWSKNPPKTLLEKLKGTRDLSEIAILYSIRLSVLQEIAKKNNIRLRV